MMNKKLTNHLEDEQEVDLDEREAHLQQKMESAQRKNAMLANITGGQESILPDSGVNQEDPLFKNSKRISDREDQYH